MEHVKARFRAAHGDGYDLLSIADVKRIFQQLDNWSDEKFETFWKSTPFAECDSVSFAKFVDWLDTADSVRKDHPRDIKTLPKAHLHLHLYQALVRRSTVAEWLAECSDDRLAMMKSRAEEKLSEYISQFATAGEEDQAWLEKKIATYQHRVHGFTRPLSVDKVLGPVLDVAAGVPPAMGDGEVWNRQFFVRELIESCPEDQGGPCALERRVCLELAEDAVSEGIRWMELGGGFSFDDPVEGSPATIRSSVMERWRKRLLARAEAMNAFPTVGIGFVVHCPSGDRQADQARAIIDFFKGEGQLDAMVGVGHWGDEQPCLDVKVKQALAVFQDANVPAVMFHAGEGCCAAGKYAKDYHGPANVVSALNAGVKRIGHGIEAARDPGIMAQIRDMNVCLEVCPYSNWLLGMAPWGPSPSSPAHPLAELIAHKVPCCLAADDPTFMGAINGHGLEREFMAARCILGLTDEELAELARCSIIFSSMSTEAREASLKDISRWLDREI